MEPRTSLDPSELAASIRELAYDARRILGDPSRSPFELRSLSRRIQGLQGQVGQEPASELARWLDSLARKVQPTVEIEARRPRFRTQSAPLGVG